MDKDKVINIIVFCIVAAGVGFFIYTAELCARAERKRLELIRTARPDARARRKLVRKIGVSYILVFEKLKEGGYYD